MIDGMPILPDLVQVIAVCLLDVVTDFFLGFARSGQKDCDQQSWANLTPQRPSPSTRQRLHEEDVVTSRTYLAGNFYNLVLSMASPTLTITSPAVGQVIGSDGKNYTYNSSESNNGLPIGVTAVAKICYVSGEHGMALAMADESSTMGWEDAKTTAAAHTPAFTGGTWKLATQDEWNNMISGAGSLSALRDGFESVGGTNMASSGYWSSTLSHDGYAFRCWFASGQWTPNIISGNLYVRSTLVF